MDRAWVFAVTFVVLFALMRGGFLNEGDVYWQARAGLDVLHGGAVIGPDTMGQPPHHVWVPNSWGWNVLLGAAWAAAGFLGLGLMVVVGVLAVLLALLTAARANGAGGAASVTALVAALPVLTLFLSGRPQLASYLGLLAVLAVLPRTVRGALRPRLTWLTLVLLTQALTVNLHLAALSTLAVAGGGALADVCACSARHGTTAGVRRGVTYLPAGAALLLGSLATPLGTGIIGQSFSVQSDSSRLIADWIPLWALGPRPLLLFVALFSLLLGGLAVTAAWRSERWVMVGALTVCMLLAVSALRFAALTSLLAVPELAWLLSRPEVEHWAATRRRLLETGAVLLLMVLVPAAALGAALLGRPSYNLVSAETVRALPAGCRVFNDYSSGGLISLLQPDLRTWIDGRNDYWGAEWVRRYTATTNALPGTVDALLAEGVNCALLSDDDGEAPLRAALQERGWQVLARQGQPRMWVLVERTDHAQERPHRSST